MEINASSIINHPRERVYAAYRNELSSVAPYVSNVKEIRVVKKEDIAGGIKLHNEWVAKGEVPAIASGIIKPEMLCWDDFATWDDAGWEVRWEIKTRFFTEKVTCRGSNRFLVESPTTTRVHLTGTLDIDLKNLPGVPRLLAGTLAPQVEKFIVMMIKPNLEQVNAAIGKYLDAKR